MKSFLFLLLVSFSLNTFSQEITEENFRKADSLIWLEYERAMDFIDSCRKVCPGIEDQLGEQSKRVYTIAARKNVDNAIRFAATPSGLQRLLWVRGDVSKDTLLSVLKGLPLEMQNSPYGKSLLMHINTKQIQELDHCYDFKATTVDGKEFSLASLRGKRVLFIYDGLGCMGQGGRDYLNNLFQSTSRDDLEIVVYGSVFNLEELVEMKVRYPFDYIFVSDFMEDHSPIKIIYGTQAMPTCFLIDREGIVRLKSEGLDTERLDKLLRD
ncbi:peroxiredoxin family protein [Butyricimonas hominis]|jgi:redoxin|uniref:Thioredoxin domain-containing protein n=1 Tax=Butyricimonas hominis TaxID=2763032 RepID=A0ABR7CX27_9BACT|nr:hypothetical protein [Butyricimonas hominis]MBC5620238.1 hypothetical protein [Butyricimonas hominis]